MCVRTVAKDSTAWNPRSPLVLKPVFGIASKHWPNNSAMYVGAWPFQGLNVSTKNLTLKWTGSPWSSEQPGGVQTSKKAVRVIQAWRNKRMNHLKLRFWHHGSQLRNVPQLEKNNSIGESKTAPRFRRLDGMDEPRVPMWCHIKGIWFSGATIIISVLSEFNWRQFDAGQTVQEDSLWLSGSFKGAVQLDIICIKMTSLNWLIIWEEEYNKNRSGPSTEPWGTPHTTWWDGQRPRTLSHNSKYVVLPHLLKTQQVSWRCCLVFIHEAELCVCTCVCFRRQRRIKEQPAGRSIILTSWGPWLLWVSTPFTRYSFSCSAKGVILFNPSLPRGRLCWLCGMMKSRGAMRS